MVPGPIFRIEAITTARQARYFLLRVLYGLLMLLLLWVSYESISVVGRSMDTTSRQQSAEIAASLFASLTWLQLTATVLIGPVFAVGTVATERERRTIEYLFVSTLSNAEIVLDKTFARLAVLLKLLLVGLPVLFIVRLLGGIPADLLAGSFLVCGSAAIAVTAISIAVSVSSARARDATVRVYLLLALAGGAPVLLGGLAYLTRDWPVWSETFQVGADWLAQLNPLIVYGEVFGSRFAAGANFDFRPILKMLAWHAALSVGCLLWATASVRRIHLRDAGRGEHRKSRDRPRWSPSRWKYRPPLGERPMLWKEAFAGTARTRLGLLGNVAGAILCIAILTTAIAAAVDAKEDYIYPLMPLTGFIGSATVLLAAARAAGLVALEKEEESWLTLVSTPLSGKEIVLGKFAGNLYAVRWLAALLLLVWMLGTYHRPALAALLPVVASAFIACVGFATALGLNYSLQYATWMRAMGQTMGVLIFVGGGYLLCLCPVGFIMSDFGEAAILGVAPCIPFLLGFTPSLLDYDPHVGFTDTTIAAFALGVAGYTIATGVLISRAIAEFDRLSGRVVRADG